MSFRLLEYILEKVVWKKCYETFTKYKSGDGICIFKFTRKYSFIFKNAKY